MKRSRPSRVRRAPAIDLDHERKLEARRRKIAPIMRELDEQDPLVRRLVHYFGTNKVNDALQYCNPEDVPARLRDVAGFAKFSEAYAAPPPKAPRPDPAKAWQAFTQSGGAKNG